MREYSFIGKLIFNGKWEKSVCPLGVMKSGLLIYDFDPETVGMDTGLVDCNNNSIYEGHIVKCRHSFIDTFEIIKEKNPRKSYGKEIEEMAFGDFQCRYWRNYVVSFHDGRTRGQNGSDTCYLKQSYIRNHEVEIIGNIHDNPELLEVR